MKTKISWGTGIFIGIIVFIVITITMVIIFMTQDVSLVADNYYERSLSYQEEIDKQSRTKALEEEVDIFFNGEVISILFPASQLSKNISGEIFFYRPSNPALDFKVSLQLDEKGNQLIPVSGFEKGFWRLKLNWVMQGNEYYIEEVIIIE